MWCGGFGGQLCCLTVLWIESWSFCVEFACSPTVQTHAGEFVFKMCHRAIAVFEVCLCPCLRGNISARVFQHKQFSLSKAAVTPPMGLKMT